MTAQEITLCFVFNLLTMVEDPRGFHNYYNRCHGTKEFEKTKSLRVRGAKLEARRRRLRRETSARYYRTHKQRMLAYQSEYRPRRYAEDFNYRLMTNLRNRVKSALDGRSKACSTLDLIGGSVEEFWTHIERQLKPGWTKENYGTVWEIDHKRPCASFDLSDLSQQKDCFHWSNCQPMLIEDNRRKNKTWGGVQ